jgi:hypothetical protein
MSKLRLSNLLKEEEPKTGSKEFPGKFHLGGGYYSSKEGGEAEFKSEDGKLRPLTPDEKAAKNAEKGGAPKPPMSKKPLGPPPMPKKPLGPPPMPKKPLGPPPMPKVGIKPPPPPPGAKKSSPPPPPPMSPKEKKANVFAKVKTGLQNWSKEEKQWFVDKVHKGNSPERRSFTDAVKHKVKGAVHAIIAGAKREAHTFKEAGKGLYNFFALKKVTPEQTKAITSVAKKVAVAAATSVAIAATGGTAGLATLAHHGSAAFLKHLAIEFIPHLTAETLAVGTARGALFAGDEEQDSEKLMVKFMDSIMDKLATEDIPEEVLVKAIESYNAEKAGNGEAQQISAEDIDTDELKEELKRMFSETESIGKAIREELNKLK